MANNFPVLSSMHVDGLDYILTMVPVEGPGFLSPGGTMTMFSHGFGTGIVDGAVGYDYSNFDQDALEAGLKQLLGVIAQAAGQLVGIDPTSILSAMSVARRWSFATDTVMSDSRPGEWIWTDEMGSLIGG